MAVNVESMLGWAVYYQPRVPYLDKHISRSNAHPTLTSAETERDFLYKPHGLTRVAIASYTIPVKYPVYYYLITTLLGVGETTLGLDGIEDF